MRQLILAVMATAHQGGSPENVAAMRAFLNFSFMAVKDKAIFVDADIPVYMIMLPQIQVYLSLCKY